MEIIACNRSCYEDVYTKLGLEKAKIDDCVSKSFEGRDINFHDNTLLRKEMERAKELQIDYLPSLLINKKPFQSLVINSIIVS